MMIAVDLRRMTMVMLTVAMTMIMVMIVIMIMIVTIKIVYKLSSQRKQRPTIITTETKTNKKQRQ